MDFLLCLQKKIGFGVSFVHISCAELHWDEQVRWLCGFCLQIRELSAWFCGWRCCGNPLSANRGWMTSRNSWTLIDSSQGPIPNSHPLTYYGILGPAVLMIYTAQGPASLPSHTTSQIFNYSSCPAFVFMWNREFRVFLIHMLPMYDTHTYTHVAWLRVILCTQAGFCTRGRCINHLKAKINLPMFKYLVPTALLTLSF